MSIAEFKRAVLRSDFLMDWQKEKLVGMLDNDGVDGNGHIRVVDVLPIVDNILWRTMGVGLDSLPPMDRLDVEHAVREVAYLT